MINKIKNYYKKYQMLRGDGNLYVLFIMASVMAGAFALTGGVIPQLNPNPSAADQVEIDEESARGSSESSLQLVDIKIKPTATPTPPPVACLNDTVITLVIDLSASMGNNGKISALNAALADFTTVMGDNAVIGGIAFGGETLSFGAVEGVRDILPYTQFGANKALVISRLTNLTPGPEGGTFMRNGFEVSLSQIRSVKPIYPTFRQVAIIFSDGVPEMYASRNPTCLATDGDVCWARQQDPRSTPYGTSSVDFTRQMEAEVDRVYSLAIYNSTPGTRGAALTGNLVTLLQTMASGGSAPFYQAVDLKTGAATDLTSYFRTIMNDACQTNS